MQDPCQDLAARRSGDDPIALADRGARRDDDDIALAIDGEHAVALDFDRIGILVDDAGGLDLIPGRADGITRIIEEAALAHLGETDERNLPTLRRLTLAAGEKIAELLDRGARGFEHPGDAFGRRPARPPIWAMTLRGIERCRIEAGLLGEARG